MHVIEIRQSCCLCFKLNNYTFICCRYYTMNTFILTIKKKFPHNITLGAQNLFHHFIAFLSDRRVRWEIHYKNECPSEIQIEVYSNHHLMWQHDSCWRWSQELIDTNVQQHSFVHSDSCFHLHIWRKSVPPFCISCNTHFLVFSAIVSHCWDLPYCSTSGLETSQALYSQSL
jgi:hypothetical protein